ncbi:MAG: hypothetical protein QM765_24715 [Myxococcales bacterium]
MKRSFRSKRGQAPRYPTLHDGRKLLLAGILGLSGCGITTPDTDGNKPPIVSKGSPDAGDITMGVAPGPGLDAEVAPAPGPDAGELIMGEAPGPGLDASVPEPAPDAGDLLMGDIAAPELDAATPPPPGPDAGDLMMGGMAEAEDAGK